MLRNGLLCRARRALPPHPCEPLEGRTLLSVGPPALVTDINTTGASSFPSALVRLGERVLFRADDGHHGREWFATDGSAAGARLLADIFPGPTGSAPTVGLANDDPYAVVGGTLLFTAIDDTRGAELWKTDGTPQGTSLVKDIRPGAVGSSPDNFTVVGNVLYFVADDGSHGRELWKSDGTDAGTQLVADLTPGSGLSGVIPLAAVGGKLLMAARQVDGSITGLEPWTSDGTAAGTALLKNINTAAGSNPGIDQQTGFLPTNARQVVSAGGYVYFAANDAAHGRELWRTDGTADGTVLVADLLAGLASSEPRALTAVGDTVYFVATVTTNPRTYALYRTDPSSATGVSLVNALSGIGDGVPVLGAAGGKLFTVAAVPSGTRGTIGLFTHDPSSPAGTGLTLLRNTGPYLPIPQRQLGDGSRYITEFNGQAYLATLRAGDTSSLELIRSDGTPQGTMAVASWPLRSGDTQDPTLAVAPFRVVAGSNGVYFDGYDADAGSELWRSDGTPAGTARAADVNTNTLGSGPGPVFDLNGRGLFYASAPGLGPELWSTDGTAGGTQLVKDIDPGSFGSQFVLPPKMVDYNGRAYFWADDGSHGVEPWSTDGTPAGTRLLKDIHATDSSYPAEFTVFRGRLWFVAKDPVHGTRLWSSDGTTQGTVMLDDAPSAALSYQSPYMLTVVGDTLYFAAAAPSTGRELWKTDGTPAGTALVHDLSYDTEPPNTDTFVSPSAMVALGGGLFFTTRSKLWHSDGTFGGTGAVKALPGDASDLTVAGGKLFFRAARTSGGGDTIWVSDGTAAGTVPIQDVTAAADLVAPAGLVADPAGDAAWFFDKPDSSSWRLWHSDGTAAGTVVVATLPGSSAAPLPRGFADGLFYFSAGGPTGVELWASDGTGPGTAMVADVNPGPRNSNPGPATAAGGRVYFEADDGTHGRELWSIPLRPVVAGRYAFYNNSASDGRRAAADAGDDAAVAPDKRPLLPGFDASGANVTGSTRGLNGVMLDVAGLPANADPNAGDPTADDFAFRWRGAGASAWAAAAAPRSVTVRRGAGSNGSDRVTLTWADGTLSDGWLEVTVKADEHTGLSRPDTFVFGNLRGDTGNDAGPPRVDAADLARTRAAIGSPAGASSPFDPNRDGRVDALDLAVVRRALFNTLGPVEWPAPAPAVASARRMRRRPGYGVL